MRYLFSLLACCLLSSPSEAIIIHGGGAAPVHSSTWTRIGPDGPWVAWDADRRVACYTLTTPATKDYYRDAALSCVHVPRGTEP